MNPSAMLSVILIVLSLSQFGDAKKGDVYVGALTELELPMRGLRASRGFDDGSGVFVRSLLQAKGKEEEEEVDLDALLGDYVFEVLAKDGDLNDPGPGGVPPLFLAAHNGFTDLLETILIYGADLNAVHSNGYTALMFAAESGHLSSVMVLIKEGADPTTKVEDTGVSAIYLASSEGYADVVEELVNAGADVNDVTIFGTSPLIIAVAGGHVETVDFLVRNSADVNAISEKGASPLLVAVQYDPNDKKATENHVEICEILLDAGADADFVKESSQSLTWIATFSDDAPVVELLLAYDADPDRPAKDGTTPLFVSVSHCDDCLEVLLAADASPDSVYPANGWTPLHFAAYLGKEAAAKSLLKYNADKTVEDSEDRLPIDIAIEEESRVSDPEVTSALKELLQPEDTPTRDTTGRRKARQGGALFPIWAVLIIAIPVLLLVLCTASKSWIKRKLRGRGSDTQVREMIAPSESSGSQGSPGYVLNPAYYGASGA